MAYYIVRYNGGYWINYELGKKALAPGDHTFVRMVAAQEVLSEPTLDQVLYKVTKKEAADYLRRYSAQFQDFDAQYRRIHVLTQEDRLQEEALDAQVPDAVLWQIDAPKEKLLRHRFTTFVPYRYCRRGHGDPRSDKERLAIVKLCKFLYVAINAVDITVNKPAIVTL